MRNMWLTYEYILWLHKCRKHGQDGKEKVNGLRKDILSRKCQKTPCHFLFKFKGLEDLFTSAVLYFYILCVCTHTTNKETIWFQIFSKRVMNKMFFCLKYDIIEQFR